MSYAPKKIDREHNSKESDCNEGMSDEDETSVKVYIQSLSRSSNYGTGSYAVSALQKMVGTPSFLDLPVGLKNCQVRDLEECHTTEYFHQVQEKCGCVPWGLEHIAEKDTNSEVRPTGLSLS